MSSAPGIGEPCARCARAARCARTARTQRALHAHGGVPRRARRARGGRHIRQKPLPLRKRLFARLQLPFFHSQRSSCHLHSATHTRWGSAGTPRRATSASQRCPPNPRPRSRPRETPRTPRGNLGTGPSTRGDGETGRRATRGWHARSEQPRRARARRAPPRPRAVAPRVYSTRTPAPARGEARADLAPGSLRTP